MSKLFLVFGSIIAGFVIPWALFYIYAWPGIVELMNTLGEVRS